MGSVFGGVVARGSEVFDAVFDGDTIGGEIASIVLTCASISCVLLRKPTKAVVLKEFGCNC